MLLHVSAISSACLVGFAVEEQQLAELTILKKNHEGKYGHERK